MGNIKGVGSYTFWGWNDTFKGGVPATDKHIPFNPMKSFECDLLTYDQEVIHLYNKLDPQILFDNKIDEYGITIRTMYRDPFLLLTLFTNKTLTTTWDGSNDVITANMSVDTYRNNNLWIEHHGYIDGTNDVNLLFDGGELTTYKWILEPGALIEEATMMFVECTESTPDIVDMDDGLDDASFNDAVSGADGGWSLWDGQAYNIASKVALSKDVTISHTYLSGLSIQSGEIVIETPKTRNWLLNSLTVGSSYDAPRPPFKATFKGIMTTDTNIAQALLGYSTKTLAPLTVAHATNKQLVCTNTYLKNISNIGIDEGGKAPETVYEIVAGANPVLSYSWTGNETTSPHNYIKHVDV